MTPIFNFNYNGEVEELGVVSPDVREGHESRTAHGGRSKSSSPRRRLADLSPDYDFVSVRVGSQFFTATSAASSSATPTGPSASSAPRTPTATSSTSSISGQPEKDTNSGLNTFDDRHQNIVIANYYRQDFIFPGYTVQGSVHYNNDGRGPRFDRNRFLVRPDPAGVFQPHQVDAVYLGWAGDGHIDRYNITHAFYWALGHDTLNPIANQAQEINAQMAAVEVSYDRDWARFRTSFFYSSGRRQRRTTATPPASTRSSTTRTSPAASSASGSGRRSPCSA